MAISFVCTEVLGEDASATEDQLKGEMCEQASERRSFSETERERE